MKYNPHNYQKYSIEFIKEHKLATLLLECGLGKTSVTLSAINDLMDSGEIHKVLVIAPLRVVNVWKQETEKWDELNDLTVSKVVGSSKEREKALSLLISYQKGDYTCLDYINSFYDFFNSSIIQ